MNEEWKESPRMNITMLRVDALEPHPDNPRIEPRQDVVDSLTRQIIADGFDPAHAIIVRPLGDSPDRYQIISGHHRVLAAKVADLVEVPAWIREISDEDAFMALALNNTHGELTSLERGMHALRSGMGLRAYADKVGRAHRSVDNEIRSARVWNECSHVGTLVDHRQLSEIYAAPQWLWQALVKAAAAEAWTVERTRKAVATFKDIGDRPLPFWNMEAITDAIVAGSLKLSEIKRAEDLVSSSYKSLVDTAKLSGSVWQETLTDRLNKADLTTPSSVMAIVNGVLSEHAEQVQQERAAEVAESRSREEATARATRLRSACTVEEWNALDAATRQELLSGDKASHPTFNRTTDSVEWAWWTWNPITGCNHGCPYCYARVIATSGRTAGAFPNGFAPTFCAARLAAPRTMKIPKAAATDTRERNVFVCSMADLFGRWVPPEWIEAVMREARAAPDWNFLCLTKFPKRMAEFDIPENVWMGATTDLQARVAATEAGFAKVNSRVKWLSVEPMLEPLRFKRLDLFHWIVIGGSSAQPATATSPATPTWRPPFLWVVDLVQQARDAGVKVYFKTNLLGHRLLELPFDAPIEPDPIEAPAVFHYLGKGQADSAEPTLMRVVA